MSSTAHVTRAVRLPDDLRVLRSSRAPELGPRILFLSGGTALRPVSRTLKQYTHNSVHLITAFDSGGSSAQLRHAFAMPGIGDLRNRIVALADESVRGNPQIYKLFQYRLPSGAEPQPLRAELDSLVSGEHQLVRDIVEPMRRIIQTHLRFFVERMKIVVEPTGCLSFAAALNGVVPCEGQRVGVVISGGNVDPKALAGYLAGR